MPTLICNNCVAGVIYSDFKHQFTSPTINLYFFQRDFLKFCNNLRYYCQLPLVETSSSKYGTFDYPIGLLGDLEVHFMHYSSFESAQESWLKRVDRMKWNNIRIIDIARETWEDELLDDFAKIPYPKVLFLNYKTTNENTVYVDVYKDKKEVGEMIGDGKVWYYYLNILEFLKTGRVRNVPFLKLLFSQFFNR